MSYYHVKPPQSSSLARVTIGVGIGVLVALVSLSLFTGWVAARPVVVSVDGMPRLVEPGETVADLSQRGALRSSPGRLLSVEGSVLATDGGDPPSVMRNGEPARLTQRVYAGDVLESTPGVDRTESTVVTDVALPNKTRIKGSGPLYEMETLGAPGIKRVRQGAISGIEVTSTVVTEPSDLVIRRFRLNKKVVALTFDDGPWPTYTARILKVLADEDVPATFFMLGRQVDRYPQLAKRAVAQGHEVGSHSYSHKLFTQLSAKQVRREIKRGRNAVKDATGESTPWLRPPYGAMNDRAWGAVRDTDARAIMWDVDSRDWTKPGSAKIARTVLRTVEPGSVVLFHDGGGNRMQTARAVRTVINKLKKRGYDFVTVGELYDMRAGRSGD